MCPIAGVPGPLAPGQKAGLKFDSAESKLYLVLGNPTTPTLPADQDDDGDVDMADFEVFNNCMNLSGPAILYVEGCEKADVDADMDVDQADFGKWQECFTGERVQAAIPDCTRFKVP